MGSYATLAVGHFSFGEWKSHVPLEPLLLFTQADYREIPADEDEECVRHIFMVAAEVAKGRMDSRGFTLATCRRLFDEFKLAEPWSSEDEYTAPPLSAVTFDEFLAACNEVYENGSSWYFAIDGSKVSAKVQSMFQEGFFDSSIWHYFEDAHFCIMARAFLEVAKPDDSVEFELSELIHGGYLAAPNASMLYDHYMTVILQRIGLDYQLYGFVIENDPNVNVRLRTRIDSFNEDAFINHVLVPLLNRMGYENVRAVDSHGRNEFGSDIRPFRYTNPMGTLEYYAVQAKAVPITGTSTKNGNAGELISQANQAFAISFVDDLDSEKKKIDKFIIATNKAITPDARRVIEEAFAGQRKLILLDIDKISELVKKHRLLQYLLFTELG